MKICSPFDFNLFGLLLSGPQQLAHHFVDQLAFGFAFELRHEFAHHLALILGPLGIHFLDDLAGDGGDFVT